VIRKLGVPGQPELAMAAIASGGVCVLNEELVRLLGIPDDVISAIATQEQCELERREREYLMAVLRLTLKPDSDSR
jgi:putative phosphoribosyl transferase